MTRKIRAPIAILVFLVVGLAAFLAIAVTHNVSTSVDPQDARAAALLMQKRGIQLKKPANFDDQLNMILQVQDAVISLAPLAQPGIPVNQPRELVDLEHAKKAECFDRSRAIETILRLSGFTVRHFNLYSTVGSQSALGAVLHARAPSHSLTEVLTSRGWMLIDSNYRYVGLTDDNQVFGIAMLRKHLDLRLNRRFKEPMPIKLRRPFTWVYGLYSRHGRFYPPYDHVPDVNWRELLYNFAS